MDKGSIYGYRGGSGARCGLGRCHLHQLLLHRCDIKPSQFVCAIHFSGVLINLDCVSKFQKRREGDSLELAGCLRCRVDELWVVR